MSADVGFTPGKLIEAAQGIEAAAEPFSQAVSTIGEDVTSASEGVNGPFMEPLGNALTMWGDSLSVLFDDLGRLAEAWWASSILLVRAKKKLCSRWSRRLPGRSRTGIRRVAACTMS